METETDASSPWVVSLRRAPATARPRARFYGFAHAGGKASVYRRWCDHLPVDVDVRAIELPGRDRREGEPFALDLSSLADDVATALGPAGLDRPLVFFGHCLGAAVAFECARAVRRRYGVEPVHLFVAGLRAPQLPRPPQVTHRMDDDALTARLVGLGGLTPALVAAPELLRRLLPRVRADFALYASYAYDAGGDGGGGPLGCPITALGGAGDPATAPPSTMLDAWREQSGGPFDRRLFPGDHFFVDAHLPAIAARVTAALAGVAA